MAEDVHYFWYGSGSLPEYTVESIGRTARLGYTPTLWVYSPVRNAPAGCVTKDAGQVVPHEWFRTNVLDSKMLAGRKESVVYASFSDVFRAAVLFEVGGWWFDVDVIPLRRLPEVEAVVATCFSPTHEWTMLPRNPDRLLASADHVSDVLEAYKVEREKSNEEFRENVRQKRGGAGKQRGGEEEEEAWKGEEDGLPRAPLRLGRDAEVRDQSVVAVSFVKDSTGGGCSSCPEPVFRVYAAFESSSAADAWARAAGDTVVAYDIDVVSTCAWLFVNDIEAEKIEQEVYRSEELSSIMSNHRKQPQMCENFQKWRDESESES